MSRYQVLKKIKDGNFPIKLSDGFFIYHLVRWQIRTNRGNSHLPKEIEVSSEEDLAVTENSIIGWRLSLRDDFHSGITKVDCESEIFGYPVVSIPHLFAKENAHKLNKNIDISEMDVQNVRNYTGLFEGNKEINIDISKWKMTEGRQYERMFADMGEIGKKRFVKLPDCINLYTGEDNSTNYKMLENLTIRNKLEFHIIDEADKHSTNYKFDSIEFTGCELSELEICRESSDAFNLTLPLHKTFGYSNMNRFALQGIEELTDDDYLKYIIMQLKERTFLIDEVDISCVKKFNPNFGYGSGCGVGVPSEKDESLFVEEFDNGKPTGRKHYIKDICPFSLNTEFLIISKSLADIYLDSLINNFGFVHINPDDENSNLDDVELNIILKNARMLKALGGGNFVYVVMNK